MVYFGETGQWFDARVQQHQTAVKKLDVKNGITAHAQQTGHTVRWSEAKCIDQHNYYVNRKMKEAIYINAYAPGEGNFGCLTLEIPVYESPKRDSWRLAFFLMKNKYIEVQSNQKW